MSTDPGRSWTSPGGDASSSGGSCSSGNLAGLDGPRVTAESFDVDGVAVTLARYPRPDYEGNPWTHWGQGIVLDDGRFVSALGDHLGRDGNSYIYIADPETGELVEVADLHSVIGHQPGSWGYGKIHAQMVASGCDVVMASYWGTRRDMEFGGSYTGDHLLRLDTASLTVESLGVPVPEHGIPSLATDGELIFGEAANPAEDVGDDAGLFFVYDPSLGEVVDVAENPAHAGFRSILVDVAGTPFVATENERLLRLQAGQLVDSGTDLPGGWLRAVTAPDANGVVYGVSRDPELFFAAQPGGEITELAEAPGYTTSVAMHPATGELLYVPGAHGRAWQHGASVFALDPVSGDERVVVQLGDLAQQEFGLVLGGTYSVAVDEARGRLFVVFNAGADADSPWGEVVLATVAL